MVVMNGPDGNKSVRPHLVLNVEDGLRRFGGDRDLFLAVVALFKEDAPAVMAEIQNSAASSDMTRLFKAAHALRGLALNVGAEEVAFEAEKLEALAQQKFVAEVAEAQTRVQKSYARLLIKLDENGSSSTS